MGCEMKKKEQKSRLIHNDSSLDAHYLVCAALSDQSFSIR